VPIFYLPAWNVPWKTPIIAFHLIQFFFHATGFSWRYLWTAVTLFTDAFVLIVQGVVYHQRDSDYGLDQYTSDDGKEMLKFAILALLTLVSICHLLDSMIENEEAEEGSNTFNGYPDFQNNHPRKGLKTESFTRSHANDTVFNRSRTMTMIPDYRSRLLHDTGPPFHGTPSLMTNGPPPYQFASSQHPYPQQPMNMMPMYPPYMYNPYAPPRYN
jgi:hypothetical protein